MSRNRREGQYLAGTVIGFIPKIDPATGHYGAPGLKRPNVRAGAGMRACYRKSKGTTFVWAVPERK